MSEWIEEAEELAPRRLYDGRLFRRLLGFLRPHWKLAGAAVVLIILSSLLQLVGPLATAVALDLFVRPAGGEEVRLTAVSKAVATQLRTRLTARNGWRAVPRQPSRKEGLQGGGLLSFRLRKCLAAAGSGLQGAARTMPPDTRWRK